VRTKKGRLALAALLVCLAVAFGTGSAHATAWSQSVAAIDWTSLNITWGGALTGVSLTQDWSISCADISGTTNCNSTNSDQKSGWVDTTATATNTSSNARAWTTDDEIYEDVSAIADGTTTGFASSWALAERRGSLEALGEVGASGSITIEADYALLQFLLSDSLGEILGGWAEAGLYLYNDDDSTEAEHNPGLLNFLPGGGLFFDSDGGTLSVTLAFDVGETGYFEAFVSNYAEAEAAIPEPATLLLLGTGLVALGLVRRRKRIL
jgi:hypothetical protein